MIKQEHDPYWQQDLAIGEGRFYRDRLFTIRLRLHTSVERFRDHQELVPLTQNRRAYLRPGPPLNPRAGDYGFYQLPF